MTALALRFRMPALLAAIHGRDHRAQRMFDHIGRVIGAAHAGFEQQVICPRLGKELESGDGRYLEKGDRRAAIDGFDLFERGIEFSRPHQLAGEADALVETHQMGGIIDMHLLAARFEKGAQIGDGRALGIGAGHVDGRRQPVLRIAQLLQERQHAIEAEIDQLGMELAEAGENGVGAGHHLFPKIDSMPVTPPARLLPLHGKVGWGCVTHNSACQSPTQLRQAPLGQAALPSPQGGGRRATS